jgi:hypothetical protein
MSGDQTRALTLAQIRALAIGINESSRSEAVARLLERIAATAPAAERIRAPLTELGAEAVLRGAGARCNEGL